MANRDGHRYGNTVVAAEAQAHFGDTINYYHYQPGDQAPRNKYDVLLESLSFDRMTARVRNVAQALPSTSMWLTSHEQFVAWANHKRISEHHGFLWIKGKPGCGKSTIMKENLRWAEHAWPDQPILTFFFNARAPEELEKSSLGLYRSLLHQLLCTHEAIRPLFTKEFSSKERNGKVESWTSAELQNFLKKLMTQGHLRFLNIFIDALDEGEDDDIRNMVDFLEEVAERAISARTVFRVCLSSRHYPHISLKRGMSIVVEKQQAHTRDMKVYIQKKLLGEGSESMCGLQETLLQKSAGIFLWIVLVVPMLNQLYDRGRGVADMNAKLASIPQDLHEIFNATLTKSREDMEECVTLLQWVLVAMDSLDAIQLSAAVKQRHHPLDFGKISDTQQDFVSRYVLNSSHGLVELTNERVPKAQFIHETVREFLIAPITTTAACTQTGTDTRPAVFDFRLQHCHSIAAETCLSYLLSVCNTGRLTRATFKEYPLAQYAAKYWWQHMQAANEMCSDRVLDLALKLFTDSITSLLSWVQIFNIDWPGPWAKPDFSLGASNINSPIYYAALTGMLMLFRNRKAPTNTGFDARGADCGNTLQAVSYRGYKEIVQMLLDAGADVNAQGGNYPNAFQIASEMGDKEIVQMLLDAGRDGESRAERVYNDALLVAAYKGHKNVVSILLEVGSDVNPQAERAYGNAVRVATYKDYKEIVKLVIAAGADVNARAGHGDNALQVASGRGYTEMVQILVDAGVDVNALGGHGDTALQVTSGRGYKEIVKILLAAEADVNARGRYGDTALQVASGKGHTEIVQMLIGAGADVDIERKYVGTALRIASSRGYKEVVQILLDAGAGVNAGGHSSISAFHAAMDKGHIQVAQILWTQIFATTQQSTGIECSRSVMLEAGEIKVLMERFGGDSEAMLRTGLAVLKEHYLIAVLEASDDYETMMRRLDEFELPGLEWINRTLLRFSGELGWRYFDADKLISKQEIDWDWEMVEDWELVEDRELVEDWELVED